MPEIMTKLEKGRAEFAYNCLKEAIGFKEINDKGYVKKVFETFISKLKEGIDKGPTSNEEGKNSIDALFESPQDYLNKDKYNGLSREKKAVIDKYKKFLENYRSYTKKIPTMILTNGLGQTLAFIKAKAEKNNAYELIYAQMTEYLRSNSAARIKMPAEKTDLTKWVISCDSTEYRHISQEVLAFLNWLSRLAEGMIEERKVRKNNE